jgi:RNA polymerase subunit RPABC4/transcription elongation factor Spt4
MNHKPQPLFILPQRKLCPVCGATSYSASGIHPQCAMQQADSRRMQKVKHPSKARKKATKSTQPTHWQKACPRCRTVVHVRKRQCQCGHAFATAKGT